MTQYKNAKGEVYNGRYVVADGHKYVSPSRAKLLKLGYKEVVTTPPPVDENEQRIWQLKERLQESDYKALKYAEGGISEDDYAPIKAERQAIRDEINKLEQKQ